MQGVGRWAVLVPIALAISCSGGDGHDGEGGEWSPDGSGASGSGAAVPGAPGSSDPSQPVGMEPIPDTVGITMTDPCFTPEQSFAWELYGGVFSRCIGCHNDFGLARQVGVALRLTFPGEADFARRNVGVLRSYAPATVDVGGTPMPLLLAKPTAQTAHVGGEVLKPGSPEARLLESFVEKLNTAPSCSEVPADAAQVALDSLTSAPPKETYARAKFALTGEVATPEELDALPTPRRCSTSSSTR